MFPSSWQVLTMPYFWSKPEIYAEVARRANLPFGSKHLGQWMARTRWAI
jgi:hypothetical protein